MLKMIMKLKNLKRDEIVIFILKLLVIILYIYGMMYQLFYFRNHVSSQYWWDIRTYTEFATLTPIYITGEEAYMCLYQPYFIWLWYPMTFLSFDMVWWIINSITILSLIYSLFILLPRLKKIDKYLEYIILFVYLLTAYENAKWGNVEFIITTIYLYLWTKNIDDNKSIVIHSFIASLCSFKFVSFLFLLIFAKKSKSFSKYLFCCVLFLVSFNIYWIIQYPYIIDINFIIYAFKHGGYTAPIFLYLRPTLSISLIYLVHIGFKMIKKNKNLDSQSFLD
jgi:hypothetical protein